MSTEDSGRTFAQSGMLQLVFLLRQLVIEIAHQGGRWARFRSVVYLLYFLVNLQVAPARFLLCHLLLRKLRLFLVRR